MRSLGLGPNTFLSRLARSTCCQRPIRFPPERRAFCPYRPPHEVMTGGPRNSFPAARVLDAFTEHHATAGRLRGRSFFRAQNAGSWFKLSKDRWRSFNPSGSLFPGKRPRISSPVAGAIFLLAYCIRCPGSLRRRKNPFAPDATSQLSTSFIPAFPALRKCLIRLHQSWGRLARGGAHAAERGMILFQGARVADRRTS